MENQPQFPAEEVTLPSKGLLYSDDSPLKKGIIEMKYMTAREEDILTNPNFIKNGTAIDKLLKSIIVTKFDHDDLLIGDKNALMLAARILGYGPEYNIKRIHPETGNEETAIIDLSTIKDKQIDPKIVKGNKNEFEFTLPFSKIPITFKFQTQGDESKVEKEIEGLKKINPNTSESAVRLNYTILSINGSYEKKNIREFTDKHLLARDARALRQHTNDIQPGVEMKADVKFKDGYVESDVFFPISLSFFWPDSGV